MNEKSLKVLEQYEIEVTSARRGRGSYICETNRGRKLLADYAGSEKKLVFVNRVLEELAKKGYAFADVVMENKEGKLVSRDRDENPYILKDWYEGRECDTKTLSDIELAVSHLADLHGKLCLPGLQEEADSACIGADLRGEMERHNRELRKIQTFIKKRKKKNEFEILFLQCFPMFYEQAQEASRYLAQSEYGELRERCIAQGKLCHGSYHQHNIWFQGRRQVFTGNFDRCRFDVPLADLYQFLRKIMEKQDWNQETGQRILEVYDHGHRLSGQEWDYLYARLFYPEKFWKLANQYYSRNKAWAPMRSADKLEVLIRQQDVRNSFLKLLE